MRVEPEDDLGADLGNNGNLAALAIGRAVIAGDGCGEGLRGRGRKPWRRLHKACGLRQRGQ